MRAKPDRNNKDFLLLACDLKSDIYKKFGFISILIALGIFGVVQPTTSALMIGVKSMNNLLDK